MTEIAALGRERSGAIRIITALVRRCGGDVHLTAADLADHPESLMIAPHDDGLYLHITQLPPLFVMGDIVEVPRERG